jgi:uncharacterized ferritin-like protein (DUF455 family)
MNDLFTRLHAALMQPEPGAKCTLTASLMHEWDGELPCAEPALPVSEPGRPARPELISFQGLPRRGLGTPEGRAAMIHALAHIEFNAINLALDAAYRFRGLPRDYYADWLKVAAEEAYHFQLLREHLRGLGFDYGDFPAHNGLWDMALRTAHDPLVRMALVPRLLEARGLDVTPGIRARLASVGDREAVRILEIIERDEIGHVAIGNHWYKHLCAERGLDPVTTFRDLLREYDAPAFGAPFHEEARRAAGFSEEELALLRAGF